jgi:hypothetical protein
MHLAHLAVKMVPADPAFAGSFFASNIVSYEKPAEAHQNQAH